MARQLDSARARRLADRVLGLANSDLEVHIVAGNEGNTRFARNEPTTSGDVAQVTVTVTASVQGRHATVSGTATDDASLAALVTEAEETAALSPVDPEVMPLLGRQTYEHVSARDAAVAKLDAAGRLAFCDVAAGVGKALGMEMAGFVTHDDRTATFANTAGLFLHVPSTSISTSMTCRSADRTGSGHASRVSHRKTDIDAKVLGDIAAEKADLSREPVAADTGRQPVILEAQAVGDLLSFLLSAMSARAADEGRSAFSSPRRFDERITLASDPGHPEHPASPIGDERLPQRKITWIEKGELMNLHRSRFWAQKTDKPAIPSPTSLHLAGTNKTLSDLVSGVDKAILVTRFWYNRLLEPRTILVTGLTRDGTFLVEQGKITKSVKNFRYNDSPLTLLGKVTALGKPERVSTRAGLVMVVPPMVVEGFNFASRSDAI